MSTCPAVLYLAIRDTGGRTTHPGAAIPCQLEDGHGDPETRIDLRHKGNHPGNGGIVLWYETTPTAPTPPKRGPGRPRKTTTEGIQTTGPDPR